MLQTAYKKVRPEPINEKSLYGSVVEFLHDVVTDKVPQTVSASGHSPTHNANHQYQTSHQANDHLNDIKEQIEWLHFEHLSHWSHSNSQSQTKNNILLMVGYKSGFQVWLIDINGVASEVVNVKESQIVDCRFIRLTNDRHQSTSCHIIFGKCKYVTNMHSNIEIITSNGGECLHRIDYYGHFIEMKSNSKLLVISGCNINGQNQIDAFDACRNYEHKFTINTCYTPVPSSPYSAKYNPFALGSRWLAFADDKFHIMFNSQGGLSNGVEQSYTATVLNTAKNISKGLVKISESVVNTVVLTTKMNSNSDCLNMMTGDKENNVNGSSSPTVSPIAGICTIVDTVKCGHRQIHDDSQNWIVAHFIAHQEAIYALEFNHSGRLLISADRLGQYFNVYLISSNPFKTTRTNVRHLYSLHRGDTTAKVKNISFSYDSRWVAVSTKRGTTHLFPINSYGGPVNSRTHSNPYVVNRSSRLARTAGFIDDDNQAKTATTTTNNPKIRHLMEPFVIQALGQLKQPFTTNTSNGNSYNLSTLTVNVVDNAITTLANTTSLLNMDTIHVATIFADTRGYLSPEEPRDFAKNRLRPVNSLFVFSNFNGNLCEYTLDVNIVKSNNKITNDSPVQLKIQPKAQWPLQRLITSSEVNFKLRPDNPLLLQMDDVSNTNGNTSSATATGSDWIKLIEISTHVGPHRRLFMGPQFLFKTINPHSINSNASLFMDQKVSHLIDLSTDVELNSLDLTKNYRASPTPIPAYLSNNGTYTAVPSLIDAGPGSYQEEMPIMSNFHKISNGYISSSFDSQKSEKEFGNNGLVGDLVETLAEAMNDVTNYPLAPNSSAAITIMGKKHRKDGILIPSVSPLPTATVNGFYTIRERCASVGGSIDGSGVKYSGVLIGCDDETRSSTSSNQSLSGPSLENIHFQDDLI